MVVGVSGGADSVCLLRFLARWQSELNVKLHVAHLDHQLRGTESEADAKYVANLAKQFGVPITIGRRDVAAYRGKRNCSVEEAARELRYDFLAEVANDVGANRVAIGHTKDDQVETILMHILRGTGTSGLRGLESCSPLPSKSYQLSAISYQILMVRPFLGITREETLNYCQEHQLRPRVDSSNLSLSFLRNRLRLELLPLLKEYNPSVDQALLRLAEIARDDSSFIEQHAFQLWGEVTKREDNAIYLNKRKICVLPPALQRQLIRLAIDKVLGDIRDIEASHIEAIRNLLSKPVGKRISLPHGLVCWSEYDEVVIAPLSPSLPVGSSERSDRGVSLGVGSTKEKQSQFPFPTCPFPALEGEFSLNVPGETTLSGWRVIAKIASEQIGKYHCESSASCHSERSEESHSTQGSIYKAISDEFDLRQVGTELLVRQRRPGDRFQPLGMNMPKKLQGFMVDAKIPLSWRDYIPLVCSPQQIIWVVGWRIDDRVKVTEATKQIIRLEFIKSS